MSQITNNGHVGDAIFAKSLDMLASILLGYTSYAPSLKGVYSEIFKALKPGVHRDSASLPTETTTSYTSTTSTPIRDWDDSQNKTPKPFDGTTKELDPFLTQLQGYFGILNLHEKEFQTNGDGAGMSARAEEIFEDYNVFVHELTNVFGDVGQQRTAENRLEQLKQTGKCSEYAMKFRELGAKPNGPTPRS
ncbi:hypothetical protein PT974_02899 [Cladobotryum mycophilum]|uniref:Retrotransposon gag domain-containing protein n=1 Tax=Cladobotryum mycophilum TaxID=491253 RepID=A0ABR0T0J9_9HYPO